MRVNSLCILVAGLFLNALSYGEAIHIGPLPYLSVADSPFDLLDLGHSFFLEDYEGTTMTEVVRAVGNVRGPSPETDSVDADDGVVDGSGIDGSSLSSFLVATFPTFPLTYDSYQWFLFSPNIFGELPNAVGLVWTDGPENSLTVFSAYDAEGVEIGHISASGFANGSLSGETSDDRFFGLIANVGITFVSINTIYRDHLQRGPIPIETDHLQFGYGVALPEPNSWGHISVLIISMGGRLLYRRRL